MGRKWWEGLIGSKKSETSDETAEGRIRHAAETHAEDLDLSRLGLPELPESLGQLTALRELALMDNRLTALPESLRQLTALQTLDLGFNQLTVLPESLGQFRALRMLILMGNQLTALPESLGQLTALHALFLGSNRLTALPESLGQLAALQTLDLSHNRLTALPESLGQLATLQTLDLTDNRLSALPGSLGQLTALQRLDLDSNQLSALPESLGQLAALQTLDLSHNQLSALPESLGRLNRLRELYLHDNPHLGLPAEVLGPNLQEVHGKQKTQASPKSILDYYFRSRQARPLNEAKLILIGRGAVGKSSLVDCLVHKKPFDPNKKKTEGIQIAAWPLKLNGEEVRLHVWDFGGQEIMHATHQFFLTERSLYLLVLNGREGGEDADADYWLRLIESFGGNSPVIVVLNKIKEHPFDLNRRALEQKYVGIREFVPTDCEDGTGIEELRRAIERETDRLEDLRVKFPTAWFAIKDRLAGMPKNYLAFEEYREECEQLGEREAEAQEKLAGFLHSLGIVLNFRDDPRLTDTHVLNPVWVTSGIYTVLNSHKLAEHDGQISVSDLGGMLDKQKYPPRMHGFLLDLMRKFDSASPYDQPGRYLIPELLDKQEPAETAEFVPEKCLNFQ